MANAAPERDINGYDDSVSAGPSSASNGVANGVPQVDRYGFVGGDQYTDPNGEKNRVPIEVLRKREIKWLDMFENWEKWMNKKFKKVKERCRKGIPPAMRARAWQYLCGSKYLAENNRGKFDFYISASGDTKAVDDITKDLHRQFPFHEMFMAREGHGQEDLFRVLKAYTVHNPRDGYCQAQAPIAAILLMHMPAEQAFWCLVSICEKYLPGYYSQGLEAVQVDGDVLFGLLKKSSPAIYKHLKKQKIDPILYMTEWFMCVYTRTLPWTAVLRVWDMFFCEGVKIMFKIALVLFKHTLTQADLKDCPTLYETMEKIRHIPSHVMEDDFLVAELVTLKVTERDMEKEHQFQVARRKALKDGDKGTKSKKKKKTHANSPSPDS